MESESFGAFSYSAGLFPAVHKLMRLATFAVRCESLVYNL